MSLPVVEEIMLYAGPGPGRLFLEDEAGNRYTPEQWFVLQQMDRLETKIDALMSALGRQ